MKCGRPEVLVHGKHGYIAICHGCGQFSLAFGTVLMNVDQGELTYLQQLLQNDIVLNRERICPGEKAFHFYLTENKKYSLVLTYNEMEKLEGMIAQAMLVREAQMIANDDRPI